jgi:UDP-N-acetylglucosamine acyltransferase
MAKIHSTAIVDSGAELDSTVEIGPFCIVGPNVKIAKGTKLHSNVVIEGHTTIGERNNIFPFSVIGAIPQDLKYKGEPTRVEIGNDNSIRESVTINLGTSQYGGVTRLGNNNLLMAYVHLGHDCLVRNNVVLSNSVGLAGHVEVMDYAIINGQSGVAQFVRVGEHAYVGAQSGLERDVTPFTIVVGNRPLDVKGANIVGLRRRGFTAETIQKINEAIKLWTRTDIQKEQCLLEIESQYIEIPEIKRFLEFIRESKSGVAR